MYKNCLRDNGKKMERKKNGQRKQIINQIKF